MWSRDGYKSKDVIVSAEPMTPSGLDQLHAQYVVAVAKTCAATVENAYSNNRRYDSEFEALKLARLLVAALESGMNRNGMVVPV